MKKIAILTFHRANNYGAVLQAHALSCMIRKLGLDAQVLDYRPADMESFYHSPIPRTRNFKIFIILLIHRYLRDIATYRRFAAFRRENMHISPETYRTSRDLTAANDIYDTFIAGSDQIWNPDIVKVQGKGADYSYFLDFVIDASKKKSYAASMGVSALSEDICTLYRDKLHDFATITVREHKAAELLKSLLGRAIKTVCDPVLLMTEKEWEQYEHPYELPCKDYVLVYAVGGGRDLLPYASRLAAEKNCTVYAIQPPIVGAVSGNRKQRLTGVGPSEFVWLIRHAQAVVTTSFHGSAFSLLFRKELHVMQEDKAKENNRNSRFDSLFQYFGIQDESMEDRQFNERRVKVASPDAGNKAIFEMNQKIAGEILRSLCD